MKLKLLVFITLLCLFPCIVNASVNASELPIVAPKITQNINVALDCDKCFLKDDISVKFQLFVEDRPIEGYELVLNKDNGYKGVFDNLPIYTGDTGEEIPFNVKYYDNGNYYDLNEDEIGLKVVKIAMWVPVDNQNIEEGHDYMLLSAKKNMIKSDNYKIYALNSDLSSIEINLDRFRYYSPSDNDYSNYAILNDPPASAIWHYEKPIMIIRNGISLQDDLESKYGYFKNYNNEYLSLVGSLTNIEDNIYFTTSNKTGWQESEQAIYERYLDLIPYGRKDFIIGSDIYWNAYLPTNYDASIKNWQDGYDVRYLSIDNNMNVTAVDNYEDATFIVAFEKGEDKEVRLLDLQYTKKMCTGDQTEITLKVNSSKSLTTIFDDMDDLDLVRDCIIEDETIAKIEDGQIIPLAVGKTDIIVNYKDNQYRIILNVTEDDLINNNEDEDNEEEPPIENPHTGTLLPICFSLIIISAGIINYKSIKNKKYFIK